MSRINTEIRNPNIKWHKFITTFINEADIPEVREEITPYEKNQYVKEHDFWKILSIVEIDGKKPASKCSFCHKDFKLGDKVINQKFIEHTIVFLNDNLAYFGESYKGEDTLDIREQLRYIVHADHTTIELKDKYKYGQQLWDEGMKLCREAQQALFKERY